MTSAVLAGCGGSSSHAPTAPTVRYAFRDDALVPAVATVKAAARVVLEVSAADGRPHGVVIRAPQGRIRLIALPDTPARATLRALTAGTALRLVPDGAAAPVLLRVR